MKLLTRCQVHGMRAMGVKTVRPEPAAPVMKQLTFCQANMTRVGVNGVRPSYYTCHGITHFL